MKITTKSIEKIFGKNILQGDFQNGYVYGCGYFLTVKEATMNYISHEYFDELIVLFPAPNPLGRHYRLRKQCSSIEDIENIYNNLTRIRKERQSK